MCGSAQYVFRMRNKADPLLDLNSERMKEKRERQSTEKSVPEQAPLKEQGQPAWREVKQRYDAPAIAKFPDKPITR
jgi:hypothetical protein